MNIEVIIFGLVRFLYIKKKSNQTELKKKSETGSNRSVSVWFCFLGQNRFKPV